MDDDILTFKTGWIQVQAAALAANTCYGMPAGLKIRGRGRSDKTARSCYCDTHGIILLTPGSMMGANMLYLNTQRIF